MTKRLSLLCLAVLIGLSAGCLFSRKSRKASESSSITAETEQSLKQHWIDKRVTELTAQGVKPDAARQQATEEFRQKFEYTSAAKQ